MHTSIRRALKGLPTPELRGEKRIELRANASVKAHVAFFQSEDLAACTELVWQMDMSVNALKALFASPLWPRLKRVSLGSTHRKKPLGAKGGQALAGAVWSHLEWVGLGTLGLGDEGIAALAAIDFGALQRLNLGGNGLTSLSALADNPVLSRLRALRLRRNALARLPEVAWDLRELDLSENRFTEVPWVGPLRVLKAHHDRLDDAAAEALAHSALPNTLEVLELHGNPFGEEATRALATAPWRRLREVFVDWPEPFTQSPTVPAPARQYLVDKLGLELPDASIEELLQRRGVEGDLGWTGAPWSEAPPESLARELLSDLPRLSGRLTRASRVVPLQSGERWFLVWRLDSGLFMMGAPAPEAEVFPEVYGRFDGLGVPWFEGGEVGFEPGLMPWTMLEAPDVPGGQDLLRITRGWGEAGEGGWCALPEGGFVDVEDRFGQRGEEVPGTLLEFLDRYLTEQPLPEAER